MTESTRNLVQGLRLFSGVVAKESHQLLRTPELLWQQLYNRLKYEGYPTPPRPTQAYLARAYRHRAASNAEPWLDLLTPPEESSALIRTLRGHGGPVTACAFLPDGATIVSACGARGDPTVRLWEAATGEEVAVLEGHEGPVNSCAVSPDGGTIASGGGWSTGTVRLWDAHTGAALRTLEHPPHVYACAFSPDGRRLASASRDGTIRLWDARSGVKLDVLDHGNGSAFSCAFSPDGRQLVASCGRQILLVDLSVGTVRTANHGDDPRVPCCGFSPDGTRIASAGVEGTVILWDAASLTPIHILEGHSSAVHECTFSPDGEWLVSAGRDRTIRLWDVGSAEVVAMLPGHTNEVYSCQFNPRGDRILTAGEDGCLRLWDSNMIDRALAARHPTWVSSCAYSPDGRYLVSGGGQDPRKGMSSRSRQVYGIAFDPADDDTLDLRETTTGQTIATLAGHTGSINGCDFSADSTLLASASFDRTIKLWEIPSGELRTTLLDERLKAPPASYYVACAFPPDGESLVSAGGDSFGHRDGDNVPVIWDLSEGEVVLELEGHTRKVHDCAYSPDGLLIATASGEKVLEDSNDTTVRLWDAAHWRGPRRAPARRSSPGLCIFPQRYVRRLGQRRWPRPNLGCRLRAEDHGAPASYRPGPGLRVQPRRHARNHGERRRYTSSVGCADGR